MEKVEPIATIHEETGKRIPQEVVDQMAYGVFHFILSKSNLKLSELNFLAMRLGPGKHLRGRKLMGGLVTPDGFDYFHEVRLPRPPNRKSCLIDI
jgi:hypothetical protein